MPNLTNLGHIFFKDILFCHSTYRLSKIWRLTLEELMNKASLNLEISKKIAKSSNIQYLSRYLMHQPQKTLKFPKN